MHAYAFEFGSMECLEEKLLSERVVRKSSSAYVISMYAHTSRRQRLGESPGVRWISFCLYSRMPVTPNTPWASDMVATSGFTQLPLCFTRIRWTAEFGGREHIAIVPNQLGKRCSLYRLFLALSIRGETSVFYLLLVKYR